MVAIYHRKCNCHIAFYCYSPGLAIHYKKEDGSLHMLAEELFPSSFPEKSLVIPKDVTFKAKDGMPIHGQLFLPPDYEPNKKYPVLIFFHGG